MPRFIIVGLVGIFLFIMMMYGLVLAAGPEAERGKRIYKEKRCGLCHAIGGVGSKKGPDLSDIGNKRDAEWLMKFFKDPKGTEPGAKMLPIKATQDELSALVDYMLSLRK